MSSIDLVLVCMRVRDEVDKASWTCCGDDWERAGICGFGKWFVHGLHMCRTKGEGLRVVCFGSLGMVLGGGWVGGRRIGVDGWWYMGFGDCRKCNGAFMLDERRRRMGEELGMLGLVVDGATRVDLNELFCCV